jgi:DNA-directed RNA polymerase subunit M/transcription elongation factor TFIIS
MEFDPNDLVCPKCDSNAVHFVELSSTKPEHSILQCLVCGHVWGLPKDPTDPPPTPPAED